MKAIKGEFPNSLWTIIGAGLLNIFVFSWHSNYLLYSASTGFAKFNFHGGPTEIFD